MTQKECNVETARLNVASAESKLREARMALETGARKAKAEYEQTVGRLQHEVARAQIEVEKEKRFLSVAQAKLTEPYKSNED